MTARVRAPFFYGKQASSNRESLISFLENEIAPRHLQKYRFYPKAFISNFGNPAQEGLLGLMKEL